MPEYLSPGVYVEEVDRGARPIQGVGTACAAFVGFAPAGPANKPTLITNWSQYVAAFGAIGDDGRRSPHLPGAYLSHAVYGYFLNGGGRCYVVRVAPPAASGDSAPAPTVQLPSRSSNAMPSLTITAKGDVSEDIEIEVAPATAIAPAAPPEAAPKPEGGDEAKSEDAATPLPANALDGVFTLRVRRGDVRESFENVTLAKRAGSATGVRNAVETINQTSVLITLAEATTTGTIADRAPEVGTYLLKAVAQRALAPTVQSGDFKGDVAERSGIEGLEVAEDVTIVCCPDVMAVYQNGGMDKNAVKAVQLAMIAHCEIMGDRMALIDPLPDLTPQEVKRWREADAGYDSKYAALYYPWIKVDGPDGRPLAVPPCGHIAGIYARNDTERGVHKAPANEVIRGALESVTQVTKGEQDTLNPIGVNCVRAFNGRGLRVWGARTLSSDPAWRYVNVRRLFNFIEKSIEQGTQWVVFEPNDEDLWARVRRDVDAYLTGVWRDGMLFGASPAQAFYVKCDAETNPVDVRDRGQLIVEIGVSPVKPAEFVVFRLSQWAGGGA